jgi:hypothetical protein
MQLNATNAKEARREAQRKYPEGCNLKGYDKNGDCVYMTTVRPKGDKHPVATATKNRSALPVKFIVG